MHHMTFFDWLLTPDGTEFVRVLNIFLLAVATFVTWLTHRRVGEVEDRVKDNSVKLDQHIDTHTILDSTEEPPPAVPPSS